MFDRHALLFGFDARSNVRIECFGTLMVKVENKPPKSGFDNLCR